MQGKGGAVTTAMAGGAENRLVPCEMAKVEMLAEIGQTYTSGGRVSLRQAEIHRDRED